MQVTRVNLFQYKVTPHPNPLPQGERGNMLCNDVFIRFTGRTPEDFYAQPFNQKGMPSSMRGFLYEDFENRKHIPPVQILDSIFEPIKKGGAKNLDEVREMIANEPLFAELTSIPRVKTGLIRQIELFKDDEKVSLFKNGENDLGMYLLRKIYLEGLNLDDINKEFKKDISAVYRGLPDLRYADTKSYGIKFPELAFWNSFQATRKKREFKNVELTNEQKEALSRARSGKQATVTRKKVEMPDFKIKQLVDDLDGNTLDEMQAIIKKKTEKSKDEAEKEQLSFVAKYLSPIMIFVQDETALGLRMTDYSSTKKFWDNNPDAKKLFSEVMIATIKKFQYAYGTNEFDALLEESQQIQEERAYYKTLLDKQKSEQQLKHEARQKDYDELGADFWPKATVEPPPKPAVNESTVPERELSLDERFKKILFFGNDEVIPNRYLEEYFEFLLKDKRLTDDIKKMAVYALSDGDYEEVSKKLHDVITPMEYDYGILNIGKVQALRQSVIDMLSEGANADYVASLQEQDIKELLDKLVEENPVPNIKSTLSQKYREYCKPLGQLETIRIRDEFIKRLNNPKYQFEEPFAIQFTNDWRSSNGISEFHTNLIKEKKFIEEYGASAKIIIDKNTPPAVKRAKIENMITYFVLCELADEQDVQERLDKFNLKRVLGKEASISARPVLVSKHL